MSVSKSSALDSISKVANPHKKIKIELAASTSKETTNPLNQITCVEKNNKNMSIVLNEPLYCLCRQPAHGQMMGCDNSECQIEWFHFECVGLNTKPTRKWYCPSCKV